MSPLCPIFVHHSHSFRITEPSSNLVWHLTEEANSIALEDSINKSNTAMLAATTKSSKGKGKERSKSKRDEIKCTNTNRLVQEDGYSLPNDPTALIVTSDFKAEAEALAVSNSSGIILDSGASRHFSPDRSKLLQRTRKG